MQVRTAPRSHAARMMLSQMVGPRCQHACHATKASAPLSDLVFGVCGLFMAGKQRSPSRALRHAARLRQVHSACSPALTMTKSPSTGTSELVARMGRYQGSWTRSLAGMTCRAALSRP